MRTNQTAPKGFTLIELLVVIAIIGLLSSVVLAATNTARDKSRVAKSKQEMSEIINAIEVARNETGTRLMDITGSACTRCGGATTYQTSMQRISDAGGGVYQGLGKITTDPWGGAYALDENEGEGGGCTPDELRTSNSKVGYRFPYASAYCKTNGTGTIGWYYN